MVQSNENKTRDFCVIIFKLQLPGCRDSYLESIAGETQAQLSADHHGFHGSPAFTAHRPPHQRAVSLHQHLYTALIGVTPSTQTQLTSRQTQQVHQHNDYSTSTGEPYTVT